MVNLNNLAHNALGQQAQANALRTQGQIDALTAGEDMIDILHRQDGVVNSIRNLVQAAHEDETRGGTETFRFPVIADMHHPVERPDHHQDRFASISRRTTPTHANTQRHTAIPVRAGAAQQPLGPGRTHFWVAPVYKELIEAAGSGKRGMPTKRETNNAGIDKRFGRKRVIRYPGDRGMAFRPTGITTYLGAQLYIGDEHGRPDTMAPIGEISVELADGSERLALDALQWARATRQAVEDTPPTANIFNGLDERKQPKPNKPKQRALVDELVRDTARDAYPHVDKMHDVDAGLNQLASLMQQVRADVQATGHLTVAQQPPRR